MLTDSKSHIDVFPGQYLVNRFGRNRRKARVYNKGLLQSLSRQQAGKRGVDSNRHGMRQGRTKWHQRVRENGRAKGHKSRNKGLNNIIWPTMWRWRKRVKKRWRKTCSWCQKRFHAGAQVLWRNVCIGEELTSPAMGVETVACSEARATFMEFMTADKRAGSRAAGREKGGPATDVNMEGTNLNYRVYRHVCQRRINIQGFQSEQRVAKETSWLAVVSLVVVIARREKFLKYQQVIINDPKGQQARKQTHEVPLLRWKRPPWATLKGTPPDLHCLKINLA